MKNMEKVFGLVLVIALAVVLCVSCAKIGGEETAEMKIRLVNASGLELAKITLKDRIGSEHRIWTAESLADGSEVTITIKPAVRNGAPELDFFYSSGDTLYADLIAEKGDRTITFRPDAKGNIIAEAENR